MIHHFYKEEGSWYIDLPHFIEEGLITQGDCLMVMGADTMLDILSSGSSGVVLALEKTYREGYSKLLFLGQGVNREALKEYGHPEVFGGAYYLVEDHDMEIWICPTTLLVFGEYPETIYYQVIS